MATMKTTCAQNTSVVVGNVKFMIRRAKVVYDNARRDSKFDLEMSKTMYYIVQLKYSTNSVPTYTTTLSLVHEVLIVLCAPTTA